MGGLLGLNTNITPPWVNLTPPWVILNFLREHDTNQRRDPHRNKHSASHAMAAAAGHAGVAALQMQTLHSVVKTLSKRVQAFEDAAPEPKRLKGVGSGELSKHDLQKVNCMKALGATVRQYMAVDEQGVELDGLGDMGLMTYFDVNVGMFSDLVVGCDRVLHLASHCLFVSVVSNFAPLCSYMQALSRETTCSSLRRWSSSRSATQPRLKFTSTRSMTLWSCRTVC
jgi:hypothetical protein